MRNKPKPPALPPPAVDPAALAAESFRLAAIHYHAAADHAALVDRHLRDARKAAKVGEADAARDRLAALGDAADAAEGLASDALCNAIQLLAPGETVGRLYRLGQDWAVRGAVWGGKLYTSSIGDLEDCGRPLLMVLDMKDVVSIEEG